MQTVQNRATASFLAALSLAIREELGHTNSALRAAFLKNLEEQIAKFFLDESPLSSQEQQSLATLHQGLLRYLRDPQLSSH